MELEWELNFRAQMKHRRETSGDTRAAFAKRLAAMGLPYHQPTVQRVEDGERPVRLDEAFVIAQALGTTVDAMTKPLTSAGEAIDAERETLMRAWGAVQQSLDDSLFKLTGLAGRLDFFATLLELHPDAADAVWGSDGERDWGKWTIWSAEGLTRFSSHRVVLAAPARVRALKQVLAEVSAMVVADAPDSDPDE